MVGFLKTKIIVTNLISTNCFQCNPRNVTTSLDCIVNVRNNYVITDTFSVTKIWVPLSNKQNMYPAFVHLFDLLRFNSLKLICTGLVDCSLRCHMYIK